MLKRRIAFDLNVLLVELQRRVQCGVQLVIASWLMRLDLDTEFFCQIFDRVLLRPAMLAFGKVNDVPA